MAKQETFDIVCRDGIKLCAILNKREMDDQGVVLLLHGRLHNKFRGPMAAIEPLLSISTVTFDARGMGQSEGETSYNNVDQEVEDLVDCFARIAQFPTPYNKILAVIGHSKGAVVALQAASTKGLPCQHVIAVSPRYNSQNLIESKSRFTQDQFQQLEEKGSFIWLHYKAGPDLENPERRPYKVSKAEYESHANRTLDCVQKLRGGVKVLCLHGKADGTVPYSHSVKVDKGIGLSQASGDVMLFEGVAHNWDNQGEARLLAKSINAWLECRLEMSPAKNTELVDHLGQHRKR